ncbi:MAG: tetratricopeptide repeat protein [Bacteroidetes bacterium]|nr:MAG: tetratricopeptide repeat protein [Bacteroidota bacterium]
MAYSSATNKFALTSTDRPLCVTSPIPAFNLIYMKQVLLTLLTLIIMAPLAAQSNSGAVFALLKKTGTTAPATTANPDKTKYERASRIFDQLLKTKGDSRLPAPKFVMSSDARYGAWTNPATGEIGLEEKAFDVAVSYQEMADAALATLLGHELIHYYEKHDLQHRMGNTGNTSQTGTEYENQADYLGGFLAYTAGFNLFDKGPELISALYKAYELPDKLEGYPTLAERREHNKQLGERLRKLTEVFDMGNLLMALNKYEDAHAYYSYVLQDFKSTATYNNAGVISVLGALNYFRPTEPEVKYHYPLELDLGSSGTRSISDFQQLRIRMLKEAVAHFDTAIILDPEYAPAWLNRGCAYALLGDLTKAQSDAGKAASMTGYAKTVRDARVLEGILADRGGNTAKAREAFTKASEQGSLLAAHNLKVLNGEPIQPAKPALTLMPTAGNETIDGLSLIDSSNIPEPDPGSEIEVTDNIRSYNNLHPGPNSRFYIMENAASGQLVYFLVTSPDYKGETLKHISIGASTAEIEAAYPAPNRTIETTGGQIRVYPNIILVQGPDGKLAKWLLYGEEI